MPGRYLSDTTARCQTITQTRFFTTYVDSCWTVPGWPIWNPWVIRIGSATVTPLGTAIQAVLPDPSSMFYISRTAVPSAINHVSLLVESVSNPVVISVVETVDGQEVVLGEQLLQSAQMSTVTISITPSTPSIRIRVRWFTAPAILRWRTICVQVPQMQSETYLVDVCDEIGDKYRFGYNGQEKVNEMSGIGNHNTAEFWEYDTRLVRRWNLDPKPNVSMSQYSTFGNNPILNLDLKGDTIGINLLIPTSTQYQMGHISFDNNQKYKRQNRDALLFAANNRIQVPKDDGVFVIDAHGSPFHLRGNDLQIGSSEARVSRPDNPVTILTYLLNRSPELSNRFKNGEHITLIFEVCNFGKKGDDGSASIAQQLSSMYPNLTIIAPDDYVNVTEGKGIDLSTGRNFVKEWVGSRDPETGKKRYGKYHIFTKGKDRGTLPIKEKKIFKQNK